MSLWVQMGKESSIKLFIQQNSKKPDEIQSTKLQ
uniref:Uncharacterized protein n=1 Tax=Trichinella nativa TaxID=6335 RepID=A0A0V1KGV6_9BILA